MLSSGVCGWAGEEGEMREMNLDARGRCRAVIRELVPSELWARNERFCGELQDAMRGHALLHDPLITALSSGQLPPEALRRLHLEFRYSFAQTFTDALLRAMVLAAGLEPRLGAVGKVAARFLLQLNVLDELGFAPGGDGYRGTPCDAHYVKFHDTLRQLEISEPEANAYVPSDAAVACRRMIESAYDDLVATLAILAVEETIFESFAGPWSTNMRERTTVDVESGYHAIHIDHGGSSLDDHHAEDLWYVLRMALTPERYEHARTATSNCLDTVHCFVRSLAGAARSS
jgi:hypothetical protein